MVFTLCHVAEQTTNEVSRALGLSEATVRVHLFRAVRKLRKLLAEERTPAGAALRRGSGSMGAVSAQPGSTRSAV
jgi:predicted transcriptional regulator